MNTVIKADLRCVAPELHLPALWCSLLRVGHNFQVFAKFSSQAGHLLCCMPSLYQDSLSVHIIVPDVALWQQHVVNGLLHNALNAGL